MRVLLALALLLSCLSGVWTRDLWPPDELREAEIAREFPDDPWIPHLNGSPFLEKPPLHYAWMALSSGFLGRSAAAARIPSVLFSVAALSLVWLWGERRVGPGAGALAAGLLGTSHLFVRTSHAAILDTSLAFWVLLSLLAWEEGRSRPWLRRWLLPCALSAAFWTKGPIGLLLVGAPVAADLCLERDGCSWARRIPWGALAGAAASCLLWTIVLHAKGGEGFLRTFWADNLFGRALPGAEHPEHAGPIHYYLYRLPAELAPAILLAPWLLWRMRRDGPEGAAGRRWLIRAAVQVALLSIPSGKRGLYLLPVLPVAALGLAEALAAAVPSERRGRWALAFAAVALCWAAGLSARSLRLDPERSLRPFCEAARALPGEPFGYRWSELTRGAVPFYLRQTVPEGETLESLSRWLGPRETGFVIADREGASEIRAAPAPLRARLEEAGRRKLPRGEWTLFRVVPRGE